MIVEKHHSNLADLVSAKALKNPEFEVLTFVDVTDDGQFVDERRDFASLEKNGQDLAGWLIAKGIKPGECFALMLQNHPEFVEAMVAASLTGTIFVPLDPRSRGDKLSFMLNIIESRFVIAGDYALDALEEVSQTLNHRQSVLVVSTGEDPSGSNAYDLLRYDAALTEGALHPTAPAKVDPQSAMFMMFTSGTTGNPKAVQRSHASYMRGVKGLRFLGVREQDTIYTGLPLCHINAQSTLLQALSMHQKGVFSRRFTKSKLWDLCRSYDCNVFTLLGGMIPEIYSVNPQPDDADNPVQLIITSGMPAEIWNGFRTRFGVEISEVYGSTEAGGTLVNVKGAGPVGSMGKPLPGQIAAILDDEDRECAPGVAGEICFRPEGGKPEKVTYFRNNEASTKKVHGGWYRSGDIGHMDEDGWFYFHYRAGGGIRRNGDFVNPAMVEAALVQNPNVADVFVYGVQTRATVAGEKAVVAALVLNESDKLDEVQHWCTTKLQKNEVPEIWQVLDAIPKTVSQKPVEREAIELLKQAGHDEVLV